MIGLTCSQPVITIMVNFPCLLFVNTAFFLNIFITEVMAVLAKISMYIFL